MEFTLDLGKMDFLNFMNSQNDHQIQSPCVQKCCLDLDDICLGCRRHINEITGWHTATNAQKQEILQNVSKRKAMDKQAVT